MSDLERARELEARNRRRITADPRFIAAGRFWSIALPVLGGIAITMPWGRVYYLPEALADPHLWQHECVHLEQIKRDGVILFSIRYLWWCVRYGYRQNPYEVEAYKRERDDDHDRHEWQ